MKHKLLQIFKKFVYICPPKLFLYLHQKIPKQKINIPVLIILLVNYFSTVNFTQQQSEFLDYSHVNKNNTSNIQILLEAVNIDSLYQTIEHLTGEKPFLLHGVKDSIMTRYSYSQGIIKAQNYLVSRFEKMGYFPEIQTFKTDLNIDLNNIIVTKIGTIYPNRFYILGAHYDSISPLDQDIAPGADDNGSGTAAVVEAVRVLKNYKFEYSLKFILFSGEEIGHYGSLYYASNAYSNKEEIDGVLNLDMIGYQAYQSPNNLFEIHTGDKSESQAIGDIVAENAMKWNLSLTPEIYSGLRSTTASDHHSFWIWRYPAILIIEDIFNNPYSNPFYHTANDTLNTLNPEYFLDMTRLAIVSLAVLAEIDSVASGITKTQTIPNDFVLFPPYPNPFNPYINIEYNLSKVSNIRIEIFDSLGRSIKLLVDQEEDAGTYHVIWDGTKSNGRKSTSGVYFISLKASNLKETRKILLLH